MNRTLVLAVAIALIWGQASAQSTPEPVQVEAWPLERISFLGREIYRHDIAAWVATDQLLESAGGTPPSDLRGWIVRPHDDGLMVRFLRIEDEIVRPGWDVVVHNGEAGPVAAPAQSVLSDEEQAQFQARETAISNLGPLRCSNSVNTVVLRDPASDEWLVWLLAATTEPNTIPVGGHYRFRISADGRTVVTRDQLSTGCLTLEPPDDGSSVAFFMTQIVSDTPVETHVFLSLLNGVPLYVAAADKLYMVAGDQIAVQDMPSEP